MHFLRPSLALVHRAPMAKASFFSSLLGRLKKEMTRIAAGGLLLPDLRAALWAAHKQKAAGGAAAEAGSGRDRRRQESGQRRGGISGARLVWVSRALSMSSWSLRSGGRHLVSQHQGNGPATRTCYRDLDLVHVRDCSLGRALHAGELGLVVDVADGESTFHPEAFGDAGFAGQGRVLGLGERVRRRAEED